MTTQRVHLRPMTADDTKQIVAWRNQDFVRHNFISQALFTEEGHRKWFEERVKPGCVAQFIICLSDGREIGSVYLRDIDRAAGVAEYGIFIGEEDVLGCGYGSETAGLAVEYAFETLQLDKVFLRFMEGNERARKSYENAGFRMIENKYETVSLDQGERRVFFMEIRREDWILGRDNQREY